MPTPSYSLLNTETFQRLNTLKAPKSVLQVLIALNAYAMGDNSCFPSLKTIREYIGTSIGLNTISCALKWLRENRFIEQNHRKSKERFVLTYRRAVKTAKGILSGLRQKNPKDLSEQKHRREPSSFKNKYKNKKRKISKREQARREAQAAEANRQREAYNASNEGVFGKLVIGEPISNLSKDKLLRLYQTFIGEPTEFTRWARQHNKGLVHNLLKYCEEMQ